MYEKITARKKCLGCRTHWANVHQQLLLVARLYDCCALEGEKEMLGINVNINTSSNCRELPGEDLMQMNVKRFGLLVVSTWWKRPWTECLSFLCYTANWAGGFSYREVYVCRHLLYSGRLLYDGKDVMKGRKSVREGIHQMMLSSCASIFFFAH